MQKKRIKSEIFYAKKKKCITKYIEKMKSFYTFRMIHAMLRTKIRRKKKEKKKEYRILIDFRKIMSLLNCYDLIEGSITELNAFVFFSSFSFFRNRY